MGGIGIITNPRSRHNLRHPNESRRLAFVLGDAGTCRETRTMEDVVLIAEEFKRRKIDILGLNGGDGTNHVTLSAIIRAYGDDPLPRIAFLKGGTMNSIAIACGVQGTPASILKNLVEKYHGGVPFKTVTRKTIRVGKDRYGFVFGTGIILNFIKMYHGGGQAGPFRAAHVLMQVAGSALVDGPLAQELARPYRMRITLDGQALDEAEYAAIGAATLHYVGLGFSPFARCYEEPRTMQYLGVKGRVRDIAMELPRVFMGKGFTPKVVDDQLVSRVLLESDEPVGYIIDGDVYKGERSIELSMGPELQVIVQ